MASQRGNFVQNESSALLVVFEMGCSYDDLCRLISRLPMIRVNDKTLPVEIIKHIANFFTIKPVIPEKVTAVKASSTDNRHDLQECLNPRKNTWWISSFGGMTKGVGEEFVEFKLSNTLCRLTSFKIEIPPLPSGPLSVRTLQLVCSNDDSLEEWKPASPVITVENRTGLQTFPLNPPVDTRSCRVVCLTNQISPFLEDFEEDSPFTTQYEAVGYFCVKFE